MKNNESNFGWLQYWYFANCDGDWEHGFGIEISTLDNPGWSISINLKDTDVENQVFDPVKVDRSEDDWFYCRVEIDQKKQTKIFYGACGPENLDELIGVFRAWVGDQITAQPKDEYYRRFKK